MKSHHKIIAVLTDAMEAEGDTAHYATLTLVHYLEAFNSLPWYVRTWLWARGMNDALWDWWYGENTCTTQTLTNYS